MEEYEFQKARIELNQCPCPFEKAVLTNRCHCHHSQRLHIAEREAASCLSPNAQVRCSELLAIFYQKARFALKQVHLGQQPHNQVMKVQCGGLHGLQSILFPKQTDSHESQVQDIDTLIEQALKIFGDIQQFPYQELITFIRCYQVRVRKTK